MTTKKENDTIKKRTKKETVKLPPWIEKPIDRMKRQQKILK